ncbi:MAG: hypothetical protein R3F14_29330 [Polyangiaceae bacterium]
MASDHVCLFGRRRWKLAWCRKLDDAGEPPSPIRYLQLTMG